MKNKANIYQIEGSKLNMYDFLDYLKGRYPILYEKYLMIEIMNVQLSNTLLDTVFINMLQLASMAGYNYIMVML